MTTASFWLALAYTSTWPIVSKTVLGNKHIRSASIAGGPLSAHFRSLSCSPPASLSRDRWIRQYSDPSRQRGLGRTAWRWRKYSPHYEDGGRRCLGGPSQALKLGWRGCMICVAEADRLVMVGLSAWARPTACKSKKDDNKSNEERQAEGNHLMLHSNRPVARLQLVLLTAHHTTLAFSDIPRPVCELWRIDCPARIRQGRLGLGMWNRGDEAIGDGDRQETPSPLSMRYRACAAAAVGSIASCG